MEPVEPADESGHDLVAVIYTPAGAQIDEPEPPDADEALSEQRVTPTARLQLRYLGFGSGERRFGIDALAERAVERLTYRVNGDNRQQLWGSRSTSRRPTPAWADRALPHRRRRGLRLRLHGCRRHPFPRHARRHPRRPLGPAHRISEQLLSRRPPDRSGRLDRLASSRRRSRSRVLAGLLSATLAVSGGAAGASSRSVRVSLNGSPVQTARPLIRTDSPAPPPRPRQHHKRHPRTSGGAASVTPMWRGTILGSKPVAALPPAGSRVRLSTSAPSSWSERPRERAPVPRVNPLEVAAVQRLRTRQRPGSVRVQWPQLLHDRPDGCLVPAVVGVETRDEHLASSGVDHQVLRISVRIATEKHGDRLSDTRPAVRGVDGRVGVVEPRDEVEISRASPDPAVVDEPMALHGRR